MLSLLAIALAVAAPAAPSPPSPKAAARAAAKSLPARPSSGARTAEPRSLRIAYSLTGDPGFTRWSTFLSLGDDRLGHWSLEGTSLGAGLRCEDRTHGGCQPFAQAILAFVWQPDGAPVGLVAGASMTSLPVGDEMKVVPGFTAGVRISAASLATLVRRRRDAKKR